MEIPAKQAASQIPLSFWEEARLGKPRWVVDPQTRAVSESTLVLPGEPCTMENASQVMRKWYCIICFKSLTCSLIPCTYWFQTDLHRINWLNFTASLWVGKTIAGQRSAVISPTKLFRGKTSPKKKPTQNPKPNTLPSQWNTRKIKALLYSGWKSRTWLLSQWQF